MDSKKIIDYIQLSISQGKTKEEIYKELLNQGWKIDDIQKAFNQIVTKEEKEDLRKKTIRIIVTIGAVLVGIGIFYLVVSNWQEITKTMKVLIIITTMVVSYVSGWLLREKYHYKKTGEALFLLGAIIYSFGLFLIIQIFPLMINLCDIFVLSMIGVLVMALAVESFLLFYFYIFIGFITVFVYWIMLRFNDYNPIFLISYLLVIIATIITFIAALFVKKRMPSELKKFY